MASYAIPTGDFQTSTLNGAFTAASTSGTIGAGLTIPAANGTLEIDYDSILGLGVDGGPESILYTAYNSGTGALTGITRAQAGTTAVAHANGANVQSGPSSNHLLTLRQIPLSMDGLTSGDFTTSSTSYVDVTGASVAYTASAYRDERLLVQGTATISNDTSTKVTLIALTATGTGVSVVIAGRARATQTTFITVPLTAVIDVTAGNTATIKFQMASGSAGTARFGMTDSDTTFKITGLAVAKTSI